MPKAYWNGHEIYDLEFRAGWVEVAFWMDDFESPLTGTGTRRVRMEDIEIRNVEEE
jgi:hypothetical protein